MRILDTDILVDLLRGYPPARAWIASLPETPAVCGIVVLELLQGARDKTEARAIAATVSPMTRVWPTATDCERALHEFSESHLRHGVGLLDALIGFTVLGLDATLCTQNLKHFRPLTGLKVQRPYSKARGGAEVMTHSAGGNRRRSRRLRLGGPRRPNV